jgi:transcription antitermination protein NusB
VSRLRSKSRRLALQAVYQWDVTATEPEAMREQFKEYDTWGRLDEELFMTLVSGVHNQVPLLDKQIATVIDRPVARLDSIELALLRLGTLELMNELSVPYRVVINEYVNLAKEFGSDDTYGYINATLDRLAKVLRAQERV